MSVISSAGVSISCDADLSSAATMVPAACSSSAAVPVPVTVVTVTWPSLRSRGLRAFVALGDFSLRAVSDNG